MKFTIIGLALLAMVTVAFVNYSPEGIIVLEGYEHGVALCDGGGDKAKQINPYATQWTEDGILYIINDGHDNDPLVQDLKALATQECAKYLKE